MTSTGDPARCSFTPRAGSERGCRSLQTSTQRSLPTCVMVARSRHSPTVSPRTSSPHRIRVRLRDYDDRQDRSGARRIRGYAHQGAHIFRHSLATELLRSGASLSEIGQLLRHESHDPTHIYAKVDIEALRTLSLPWPGGMQ